MDTGYKPPNNKFEPWPLELISSKKKKRSAKIKCPRCQSTSLHGTRLAGWNCLECDYWWTEHQQQRIQFLESLLQQIEEHPHCHNGYECSGNRVISFSHGCEFGHRCCAAIAKRWREK